MLTITINGKKELVEEGTTYEQIVAPYQKEYDDQIVLVLANKKIQELMKVPKKDCQLEFITLKDSIGHKSSVRTAIMMLIKALYDVAGRENVDRVKVEFSIGQGYYIRICGNVKIDQTLVERINVRMTQLSQENIPIVKKTYMLDDAIELFRRNRMEDKVKLFRYRRSSTVNVYRLDDVYDYFYGYMVPSTSYVKHFNVISYESGLMLLLPNPSNPTKLDFFQPQKKLFDTLMKSTAWGEKMEIETVGELNDQICKGNISDMILMQEALIESRIGEIARDIVNRGGVKFVMIAGPSSSGKTTFSHRLSIQLRAQGLIPHPIGLDDYYKNREDTPRDEFGNYNFEILDALDVELFNKDMLSLLAGEEVELPTFNFKTGRREYKGNRKKLGSDDVLVIEGIHGLNEKMSYSLPEESKYKIYISALTSMNIDEHNRIPTTDGRLLRRIVRDARTRGTTAKETIAMWSSVRRGEEEHIFPYQETADAMFNSVHVYELAVLKQFAEPLLFDIDKKDPEYYEAKRLLKFLDYFIGVSSENIPINSIVREFIGGSCFNV